MTRSGQRLSHFPHQECETEIGKLIENELVKRSLSLPACTELEEISKICLAQKISPDR